jgi:hypothetical protein
MKCATIFASRRDERKREKSTARNLPVSSRGVRHCLPLKVAPIGNHYLEYERTLSLLHMYCYVDDVSVCEEQL